MNLIEGAPNWSIATVPVSGRAAISADLDWIRAGMPA